MTHSKVIFSNTLYSESGKFYAEAPDTPDEKIAQYVLLFEHPSQVTASEDQPGRYWKNYKEK